MHFDLTYKIATLEFQESQRKLVPSPKLPLQAFRTEFWMQLYGAECPKRTAVWSNRGDAIAKLVGGPVQLKLQQMNTYRHLAGHLTHASVGLGSGSSTKGRAKEKNIGHNMCMTEDPLVICNPSVLTRCPCQ